MEPQKQHTISLSAKTQKELLIVGAIVVLAIAAVFTFYKTRDMSPPEAVKIGAAAQQITGLVAIAKVSGYFEQERVAPEVALYKSGALALADLESGKVDIATVAETPIAIDGFKRSDLRVIATIGSTDKEEKIVARRDRGILAPADLKGKKIATQKAATSPHFFLHLFLTAHGLSDKDVTISFNESKDVVAKLLSGEADAIAMSEPYGTEAKTKLGENAVVFPNDGLYNRTFNLLTTEKFAAEHPRAIEGVLKALIRAETFADKSPSEAAQMVADVYSIKRSDVDSTWGDLVLKVSLDQSILATLDDQARWALESNLVQGSSIPNFLPMLYTKGLDAVKPAAVTVTR